MKFTIETVSKMTGISSPSLRNWEKRYGFPRPIRTDGGHRFYTSSDIEFLKRAAAWIDEGYNLSQIGEFYRSRFSGDSQNGPEKDSAMEARGPAPLSSEIKDDISYRMELVYDALVKYDMAASQLHYNLLCAKLSFENLFDRVFEPIWCRLRREASLRRISVAQENYASGFLRLKLSSILSIDFPTMESAPILVATLNEEKHEGGIMLAAAHLKLRGYPVFYFGMNLPFEELTEICKDLRPRALALSYSQIESLRTDIIALSRFSIPVVVGGITLCNDRSLRELKEQAPDNVYICEKTFGSEAAQFIEMACRAKAD
jgi:MerR family transcriptional regulator, light-induced transcriptional regulator